MTDFSEEVDEILRRAGWSPDRRVDTTAWFTHFEKFGIRAHAAAKRFLSQFGGLDVIISGRGISCARTPFKLDPALCFDEEDRFLGWGGRIGRSLFPIGELDRGRFFLGIDEFGVVYLIETWFASFGPMPQAMENLVLGVKPTEKG